MANRLTNNNYIILYYSILYTIMLYICLVIIFDLSSGFLIDLIITAGRA
jgi:hypothetical protein